MTDERISELTAEGLDAAGFGVCTPPTPERARRRMEAVIRRARTEARAEERDRIRKLCMAAADEYLHDGNRLHADVAMALGTRIMIAGADESADEEPETTKAG